MPIENCLSGEVVGPYKTSESGSSYPFLITNISASSIVFVDGKAEGNTEANTPVNLEIQPLASFNFEWTIPESVTNAVLRLNYIVNSNNKTQTITYQSGTFILDDDIILQIP